MPYNYTIKGWPSPITLATKTYTVSSCDLDDMGLCYSQAGVKNPHITIHQANKEGPDDWKRTTNGTFHVVVSNKKKYEYNRQGAADFQTQATGKKKSELTTGNGSPEQALLASGLAVEFRAAIDKAITG